ncbi:MAG: glutamate 5-kinase [Endomicrobium sp.]|nr:glutamate 5-kinase [Endomicrobium sp.]
MKIVIKVGTSTLTGKDGLLNIKYISDFSENIVKLQKDKHKFLIVSSGAISAGRSRLNVNIKPITLREKQAYAAVGQPLVMNAYSDAFLRHGKIAAQILLTRYDFEKRVQYINVRNTLNTLIENDVIPIINENDSVAVEEINFGDNDTLAALVAAAIGADKLIIFTDVDGFYGGHLSKPHIIPEIETVTEQIESFASVKSSNGTGTGGMKTKLIAAKIAVSSGIDTIITNGQKLNLLKDIVSGCRAGTIIKAKQRYLKAKKSWIAFSKKSKGTVFVDTKAADVLVSRGKSLLAAGIKKVNGNFKRGDAVTISNIDTNKDFARGLINYDSETVERIKGRKTSDIKKIADVVEEEVIHCDNLVIL